MHSKQQKHLQLHSFHIVLILIAAITLGSLSIGFLLQNNPLTLAFDSYFYNLITSMPHPQWLNTLIKPFNYNFLPDYLSPLHLPSYYYFMIFFTLIYLTLTKRSLLPYAIFCFVFGTFLAYLITAIDWHFVFRPRPFLSIENQYVDQTARNIWGKLSSFPSVHARDTMLYSTLIASFFPKIKWPLFSFAFFIAFSRVYLGAHFPTDVIAGLIIGYLSAQTTLIIAKR